MIETRQKEIFDYLSADDSYHTSEEIGSALEISPSTVKKEIAYLNSLIEENGAKIKSTKGKGYKFKVIDEKSFTEFLKNDRRRYAYYHSINSSVDFRIENIIKLFLFSDTYIRQQDIAEKFHLSLSQVNKDIKKTKKILENYNLSLASKPHYGMKIIGDEKDISSVTNILLLRSAFMQVPMSLVEAARIDGMSEFRIFTDMVLPMSKPTLATVTLFTAVGHWNDWFSGSFYVRNAKLKPLATILQDMLTRQQGLSNILQKNSGAAGYRALENVKITGESLQMATIIVVILPIVIFYPFIQKYFVKGITIGSVKE